jgi:hypothetical protein
MEVIGILGILIFLAFIVWKAIVASGRDELAKEMNACPNCGAFDTVVTGKASRSDKITETRTEKKRTATHFNSYGEEIGYSEVEVEYRVPVTRSCTVTLRQCNKCSHKWEKMWSWTVKP